MDGLESVSISENSRICPPIVFVAVIFAQQRVISRIGPFTIYEFIFQEQAFAPESGLLEQPASRSVPTVASCINPVQVDFLEAEAEQRLQRFQCESLPLEPSMRIWFCLPVPWSFAVTLKTPLASMSNVTSIFGICRGAGGMPSR